MGLGAVTQDRAGARKATDLGLTLAAEAGRLDEEGQELLVQASRMAQDARPEFEAWFEAGLLLRRAGQRLAQIVRTLSSPEESIPAESGQRGDVPARDPA
jgi:hypothetical protein